MIYLKSYIDYNLFDYMIKIDKLVYNGNVYKTNVKQY